jgi:large subunit ribosomal protein L7/L12
MSEDTKKKAEEKTEEKAQPETTEKTEESKDLPELSKNAEKVLEMVSEMTVLELADLVKVMEEKFGVSAAAPVAAVAAAPAAGGDEAEKEKSVFTVMLSEVGGQKIQVIKAVREISELGLKEAKDLVEGTPAEIKADVPKEEAEEMKAKLEEAGAKVVLK